MDTTAPTILHCPSTININIEQGSFGSVVNWDEPEAIDESGDVTLLVKSHTPGAYFTVGTTVVTYLYRDHANNIASCMFSVIGSSGMYTKCYILVYNTDINSAKFLNAILAPI